MAKPKTKETQGQMMARIIRDNLDKAVELVESQGNALSNVESKCAISARISLLAASAHIEDAKALAIKAFEEGWKP